MKDSYEPIEILKFEKFCDDIVYMGKGLIIRINVNLAKSYNGNRYFFYKEFEYSLNGYKKISIKRGFDYYVSIEDIQKPTDREKVFIRLGPGEFYGFINLLEKVVDWFTSPKFKNLFGNNRGVLVVASPNVPVESLSGLPMGLKLTMNPTVIDTGKGFKPGVTISVDDDKNRSILYSMTVDNLFTVYGALSNFNMFLSAQVMLASMGIPLGTNRINLENDYRNNAFSIQQDNEQKPLPRNSSINGRVIGGAKSVEELE